MNRLVHEVEPCFLSKLGIGKQQNRLDLFACRAIPVGENNDFEVTVAFADGDVEGSLGFAFTQAGH